MSSGANFGAPVAGLINVRSPWGCEDRQDGVLPTHKEKQLLNSPADHRSACQAYQKMSEFSKTAIPKIEQAERGYCNDRFQPFTVQPIKRIALPEFRTITAECLEQAVLEMKRCILDNVLDRP